MKKFFYYFIYIVHIQLYFLCNFTIWSKSTSNSTCNITNHNLKFGDEIILFILIILKNKNAAIKIKVDENNMLSFNKIYDLRDNEKLELIVQIGGIITKIPIEKKLNLYI